MDTQKHTPVLLTDAAVAELRKLMEQDGFDTTQHLRIGVKGGGGCSGGGMSYMLGFDAPLEDDARFTVAGIPVIIKKAHALHLMGMEVGYQDNDSGRGFTFKNPFSE
ncbi:iron-sulfur cluster assembly accessory protein [Chitinophaga horti]|uniref:Iron-sulfur cluster assembly accessory protein n=1 Tax=Chitinophaga horti TaxID=2920382 RepID=A0ABY6J3N1_9BACT|nr:iron-sulfur cluster assembly accessory protein [Chitinophaga horti]UYQ94242.1 iron-sulfur cluster assembly accessory protein [Chitinophaga horti]